jgi:hypothetical protein
MDRNGAQEEDVRKGTRMDIADPDAERPAEEPSR